MQVVAQYILGNVTLEARAASEGTKQEELFVESLFPLSLTLEIETST